MTDYIRDPHATTHFSIDPAGGITSHDTSFVDDYDPHNDWGPKISDLFGDRVATQWRDASVRSLDEIQDAVRRALDRYSYPHRFVGGMVDAVGLFPAMDTHHLLLAAIKRQQRALAALMDHPNLHQGTPLAEQEIPGRGTE